MKTEETEGNWEEPWMEDAFCKHISMDNTSGRLRGKRTKRLNFWGPHIRARGEDILPLYHREASTHIYKQKSSSEIKDTFKTGQNI